MPQEWLYKATTAVASLADTRDLATIDGFLCKAHFESGDIGLSDWLAAYGVVVIRMQSWRRRTAAGGGVRKQFRRPRDPATLVATSLIWEPVAEHG